MPSTTRLTALAGALAAGVLALAAPSSSAATGVDHPGGTITRAGRTAAGDAPGEGTTATSVSPDGRYVVYQTGADGITPGDRNGFEDVYLYDRSNASTRLVSHTAAGRPGNQFSDDATFSDDGRTVYFRSLASNLPGATAGYLLEYGYDVASRTVRPVTAVNTVIRRGGPWNEWGFIPTVRIHGHYALININASLTAADRDDRQDAYVLDLRTGTLGWATATSSGGNGDGYENSAAMDAQGNVAYESSSDDVVPSPQLPAGQGNLYYWNRSTGTVRLLSTSASGDAANGDVFAATGISGGRILFGSSAGDYTDDAQPAYGTDQEFLYDLTTGGTTRISAAVDSLHPDLESTQAVLSANGRYAAYQAVIDPDVLNVPMVTYILRYDTRTARTALILQDDDAFGPRIANSGATVAFSSLSPDLAPGRDTNGDYDAYVWQRS